MSPCLATSNVFHSPARDLEMLSQAMIRPPLLAKLAEFANRIVGHFGIRSLPAARNNNRAVNDSENVGCMPHVPEPRHVLQILRSVVGLVAVLMVYLLPIGSWTKKRFGNQSVDKHSSSQILGDLENDPAIAFLGQSNRKHVCRSAWRHETAHTASI